MTTSTVERFATKYACHQLFANYEVISENSASATVQMLDKSKTPSYLVQFNGKGPHFCTCPAYRYSGDYGAQTCKHIAKVVENMCDGKGQCFPWVADNYFVPNGISLISSMADNMHGPLLGPPCDGCGARTVPLRSAV